MRLDIIPNNTVFDFYPMPKINTTKFIKPSTDRFEITESFKTA